MVKVDGATIAAEPAPDGRSARSQRTRDAVVRALLALIDEGDPKPGAQRIAERAAVSTRTVFAHFTSLDDLYRAGADQATAMVLSLLTPIDPDSSLPERIDALCTQRARVNEQIGPIRRAAALQAPFSPALAEIRDNARQASYSQLDRVLGPELDHLDPPARRRRLVALDVALCGEAWDQLRRGHGLPEDEACLVLRETVRSLVAPPPAGAGRAVGAVADRIRVEVAERALAEVDQRIGRLVAAIESGSPADLLAPRLLALRTERAAAEAAVAAARRAGDG